MQNNFFYLLQNAPESLFCVHSLHKTIARLSLYLYGAVLCVFCVLVAALSRARSFFCFFLCFFDAHRHAAREADTVCVCVQRCVPSYNMRDDAIRCIYTARMQYNSREGERGRR